MVSEELIKMIREQQKLERKTIDSLSPLVSETKNSVIRLFLNRLVLDSMKHVDILQAAIDLNMGAVVSQIDKHRMRKGLIEHIENEKLMLKNIENLAAKVEEEKTKFLLQQIADDEKRHHQILKHLLNLVEEIENIRDEDWWSLYYDRAEWLF
jgi:rubrerythrin